MTLRVALTLPGAVSLGAYEGGAVAALVTAAGALDGALVVDAIGSSSAGSITGVLAADALLRGSDPVDLLADAWVRLASLEALRSRTTDAPLSPDALQRAAQQLLGPDRPPRTGPRQADPVHLSMAVTSLGGLTYRIASIERVTPVEAVTHSDWYDVVLDASSSSADYLAAAHGALASAANALAFPPAGLDRSHDRAVYERAGITNFPRSGWFWYTDGGTTDLQPIGRTIDAFVSQSQRADQRIVVLIDPNPSIPEVGGPWFDASERPSWTRTAARALALTTQQSIYGDVRRAEKVNTHLRWMSAITHELTTAIEAIRAELDADQTARFDELLATALRRADASIEGDKMAIRTQEERPLNAAAADDDADAPSLAHVLRRAAGLEGRVPVLVDVVTPRIDPYERRPPEAQLAGEFLFHFGGFVDEHFRRSDFALGYRNLRTWLHQALPHDLPGRDAALDHVSRRYDELGWDDERFGEASLRSLSLRQDWELFRLAVHTGRVIVNDLRGW